MTGAVVLKKALSTAGTALLFAPLVAGLSAGTANAQEADSVEVAARVTADAPTVTSRAGTADALQVPRGGEPCRRGLECRRRVPGRVESWQADVLRAEVPQHRSRAIDFWRDWTQAEEVGGEPRYIARKGQILVIPMGGGSGEDADAYSKKWASYAVDKLDGRLVPGYPA